MSQQPGRLLTYLFVTCVCVCRGLEMIFDRTPDNEFCAQLLCDEVVSQSDVYISYIIGLSIYNITLTQSTVKLASVSLFEHGLYVDPSKLNVINGTGSMSRSQGHLALSFQDVADCVHGTFLCQLDFVTLAGQPGTITESTISGDSDHCSLVEKLLAARVDNLTTENTALEGKVSQLSDMSSALQSKLENATQRIAVLEALLSGSTCFKGMLSNTSRQGFLLWGRVPALCDTQTDGGGWVIIQRRTKGDVDFYRNWTDYKNGFGTPKTDFWIGLDIIHNLTLQGYSELRFDLRYGDINYFENYSDFAVADELSKYQLSVGEYSGTAGDSFTYHSDEMFSTYDNDNDISPDNCASDHHGGWWYASCYQTNLNGQWGVDNSNSTGVIWYNLTNADSTEMKVRQL